MMNQQLDREVTIQLNENEFATLNFISGKLGIAIPELMKCFIPNLPTSKEPEEAPVQSIAEPSLRGGPYRIREDFDKARISEILNELFDEKDKAITLAREIKAQLIDEEHFRDTLNSTTEKRLLRWAHPARVDDRTRFVKPKAREICMILYGFVPEREE